MALGRYLDGRVSAVLGTHTHIGTIDAQILPKGTAYVTDIGMTDQVMHVLYDIQQKDLTFIPGSRHLCGGGRICQPAGTMPAWQAMYDEKNRMVELKTFEAPHTLPAGVA